MNQFSQKVGANQNEVACIFYQTPMSSTGIQALEISLKNVN